MKNEKKTRMLVGVKLLLVIFKMTIILKAIVIFVQLKLIFNKCLYSKISNTLLKARETEKYVVLIQQTKGCMDRP